MINTGRDSIVNDIQRWADNIKEKFLLDCTFGIKIKQNNMHLETFVNLRWLIFLNQTVIHLISWGVLEDNDV